MLLLHSPAKINLFLQIIKKRPDGYHELASLMQTISLMDTIHLSFAENDHLTCTDPTIPTDDTNLVMKAINLFRRKTGLATGVQLHLEKNIPNQAGLGGGSSNAATTLWGMNLLFHKRVPEALLTSWAAELGSDVPFFLSEGTAYCTGRGEVIQPIAPLPQRDLWIVKPAEGLSTPDVYKKLNAAALPQRSLEKALTELSAGKFNCYNDLEAPAFSLMPSLAALKQRLMKQGYESVLMSGSGSAFFCIGEQKPKLSQDLFCQPVRFLQRSPGSWYEIKTL